MMEALENLPSELSFYAILIPDSIHVPGDQRSIDAPGHGFPAHSEPTLKIESFLSQDAFKKRIKELMFPRFGMAKKFRAFRMNPVKIATNIEYETVVLGE